MTVGDGVLVTVWVTLCGLWRVGDHMGEGVYTLVLELNSEVGKWIAHVSVLYSTVSTDVICRHGDDTQASK